MPARPAPLEKQLQDVVLDLLQHHPKVAWAHRMNVGVSRRGGRFIRFGKPGMHDITGQLKDGRRLEVEMKRPGEKLTAEQAEFQALVNSSGGLAFTATGCIDVLEVLGQ